MTGLAAWEMLVRGGGAAGLGAVLGLEREWHEHSAGVRTHMLVCVGAALFTLVSAYGFDSLSENGGDPTRIAAQIVTGVGFLGAGTIMRVGSGVRGLTTAASLWVVAAVGLAVGAGSYAIAAAGAAVTLLALGPVRSALNLTIVRWRHSTSTLVLDV